MPQYTIRNVPESVDRRLREEAGKRGKSLNEITVEVLRRGLGLSDDTPRYDDLDDLAGTWVADPAVDEALAEQDRIDPELWK